MQLVFRREIVYPNGHIEVEGVTPKQIARCDYCPSLAAHLIEQLSGVIEPIAVVAIVESFDDVVGVP